MSCDPHRTVRTVDLLSCLPVARSVVTRNQLYLYVSCVSCVCRMCRAVDSSDETSQRLGIPVCATSTNKQLIARIQSVKRPPPGP